MICQADLLQPSPAPYFETFQVFPKCGTMCGKKIVLLPDLELYVKIPSYLTKVNYNVPGLLLWENK